MAAHMPPLAAVERSPRLRRGLAPAWNFPQINPAKQEPLDRTDLKKRLILAAIGCSASLVNECLLPNSVVLQHFSSQRMPRPSVPAGLAGSSAAVYNPTASTRLRCGSRNGAPVPYRCPSSWLGDGRHGRGPTVRPG